MEADKSSQPLGVGSGEGLGACAEARCWCRACNRDTKGPGGWPYLATTFVVCPDCGNKRCPKATDHLNACTDSNEAGQTGSVFGGVCIYPDCHCPFDAPADPNWCAKGLPHLKTPNVRGKLRP
jgi:hypothetical protein